MRDWFKAMFDDVKIARLYGISALRSKICLYTLDRDTGDIMSEESLLVVFELRIRLLKIGGAWILLRRKVMVIFKKLLLR